MKCASHLYRQLPVETHACVHSMYITEHSLLYVLVINFISIMMSRMTLVYIQTLLCVCVCVCVCERECVCVCVCVCVCMHMHTHIYIVNPLGPELSAQCTRPKTQNLNSCPSLCTFSAHHFSEFSASHCTMTVVDVWCQRVEEIYARC